MTPTPKPSPEYSIRHLLTQTGWGGVMELCGLALRYGLAVLIARLGGAEGLGLYVLAIAFARGASLIGRLGMDRTLMRFLAFHTGRHELAASAGVARFTAAVTLGLSSVAAAALFLLASPIASAYGEADLAPALRLIALAVPLIALGEIWGDGLRASEEVRLAGFAEKILIPLVTSTLLVAAYAVGGVQPLTAIGAAVLAYGASAALVGVVFWRQASVSAESPQYHSREWLRFAIPISGEGLLLYILSWSDQLLVGFFLGASDVGIYSGAVRLAALVGIPLLAVSAILGPTVARLHGQAAFEQLRQAYGRMAWLCAVAGASLAIAIALAGPLLLSIFGSDFQAAYPALIILLIGQVINTGTGSAGLVLGMTGHVAWRLVNAVIAAVLIVTLSNLLIPAWGIVGAAIASATALAVVNVLQATEVRILLGVWPYPRSGFVYWVSRLRDRWQRAMRYGRAMD